MDADVVVGVSTSHTAGVELRHINELELPAVPDSRGRVLLLSLQELAVELGELVLDLVDASLHNRDPARGGVVVMDRTLATRGPAHQDHVHILVAVDKVAGVFFRVSGI